MVEASDIKREILQAVVQAYRDEYSEVLSKWRDLEGKAQGTVAIAGLFLAGVFAFIRQISAETQWIEQVLLCVAVLLLGLTVWYAVRVLTIRKVATPPPPKDYEDAARALVEIEEPAELDGRYVNLAYDLAKAWSETNASVGSANEGKAKSLFVAQQCLRAAIFVVALITLLAIV